mmetsp:Transcript_13609/g.31631  ORF Transcript_13609/g.31631 Transcript_13609/m.31631 type:complete len:85 (+) Transcript_13609:81-335(+)
MIAIKRSHGPKAAYVAYAGAGAVLPTTISRVLPSAKGVETISRAQQQVEIPTIMRTGEGLATVRSLTPQNHGEVLATGASQTGL